MIISPERRLRALFRAYAVIGSRFRSQRMAGFVRTMRPAPGQRLIDLGGDPRTWDGAPSWLSVTVVNTDADRASAAGDGTSFVVADARELPFADDSFDIAFSNSVIEHVGDIGDQARLAREMRRLASAYYLQTPARSFPIEPHYLTPFVHWLPRSVRHRVLRNFTVWGLIARPSQEYVDYSVATTRLLTRAELGNLFPDAVISPEKFLGLTKSWVVVRAPGGRRPSAGL